MKSPTLSSALDNMNSRFAFVTDPVGVLDLSSHTLYRVSDFKLRCANEHARKQDGDSETLVQVAPQWIGWSKRRDVAGLCYEPGHPSVTADKKLNLWRGLPVQPQDGNVALWDALMNHIFGRANPERRW